MAQLLLLLLSSSLALPDFASVGRGYAVPFAFCVSSYYYSYSALGAVAVAHAADVAQVAAGVALAALARVAAISAAVVNVA